MAEGEFYLAGNTTEYMQYRYYAYGAWMFSAWSGVGMIFMNDNSVSVLSESGVNPKFGLTVWGFFLSGWPFVIFVVMWYGNLFPNYLAKLTLDGYG